MNQDSLLGQAFLQDLIKASSAVVLIWLVKNCNERLPQFEISRTVDYQYNIGQSREIQNRRGEEGDGGGEESPLPWSVPRGDSVLLKHRAVQEQ